MENLFFYARLRMEIGIGIISDVGQFSFSRKEEFSSPSLLFLPLVSTLEEAESAERGGVKKRKHQERVRSWLRPSCLPGTPPGRGSDIKPGVADSQTRNFIIKLGSTSTLPRGLFLWLKVLDNFSWPKSYWRICGMRASTRRSWLEKATRGNTAISWLCPRSSSAAVWQSACPGHGEEWRVKTVPAVQMRTKLKNKHLHGVTIQHALVPRRF